MQIYENQSKNRYPMLVGVTWNMYKEGRTPEQIALKINQPIEKVMECIERCKAARRKLFKSKTCEGCIYDKDTCECTTDCDRDSYGYYTGYIR